MQYAICYGNPVDGFFFVGPFDDRDDSVSYAEREHDSRDWWIVEILPPAIDDTEE